MVRAAKYIGLGRFIFTIIDKPIVVHAMDGVVERLNADEDNPVTSFIATGWQGKLLRVEVVPILTPAKELNGFMFILVVAADIKQDNFLV